MSRSKTERNYLLLPVLFIAMLYPLVSRFAVATVNLSRYAWASDTDKHIDAFLLWKSWIVIIVGIIMVVLLCGSMLIEWKIEPVDREMFFLFAYVIMAVISSFVSSNRSYSMSGMVDSYESIWVIICYSILVLYTYYIIKKEADVRRLLCCICVGALILSLIGIGQMLSHDIFSTSIGKSILIPADWTRSGGSNQFDYVINAFTNVYMTLFNSNYVGVYASLILPVLLTGVFVFREKYLRCLFGITSVSFAVCTFGAGAKTAVLTLSIVGLISIFLFYQKLKVYWKTAIVILGSTIVILVGTGLITGYDYVSNFSHALSMEKNQYGLQELSVTQKGIVLKYKGTSYYVNYENDQSCSITDQNGNVMRTKEANQQITFVNSKLSGIFIDFLQKEEWKCICLNIDGNRWFFTREPDGTYQYVNQHGKTDSLVKAPYALFKGHESMLSGRGYIWSRTIPMLKDHILLGAGADNFMVEFPQNDYVMKWNSGLGDQLVSRAHNMYLQTWIQSGAIGFVCLMIFYISYICSSFRLYGRKDKYSTLSMMGCGIFLGTMGYLIAMLSNDSMVVTAPLHFVLLGTGMAVNRLVKSGN